MFSPRRALARLRANSFSRAVSVLVGGTVVAHAVTVLALPVITRLYSPEDFSALAVFTSLVVIVGGVVCLRYDTAIPLPDDDVDAANVMALAFATSTVISLALASAVLLGPERLAGWLNQPALGPYLWLFPLAAMILGWHQALEFWSVRGKAFPALAISRISRGIVGAGTQLGFGFLGSGPLGLLLGQMSNTGTGCVVLTQRVLRRDRKVMREVRGHRMRSLAREYDRFPKLSTPDALSNTAGLYLPVVLISIVSTGPEPGYLNLAMSTMQMPMSLIGGAIGQVYLSHAPEKHRGGELGPFTAEVMGNLLKSGVGPLIFAGIVAPWLFPPVFGQEWQRAGELVSWMTPWFVGQFLAAPLSMALYVANRFRTALTLQVSGLVVRVAAVLVAAAILPARVSEAYSLAGFVYYVAFLLIVLRVVGARGRDLAAEVRSALPVVLLWTAVGALVALAARALVG